MSVDSSLTAPRVQALRPRHLAITDAVRRVIALPELLVLLVPDASLALGVAALPVSACPAVVC